MTLILQATRQHARNLAAFVTIYKSLMLAQYYVHGGVEYSMDAFLAGLAGGYYVFGENNNINQQIVLYVFARVMMGLAKLPVEKQLITQPQKPFAVFAALSWALVMWLFRHERRVLQPSLQASMQYLYLDSDKWTSLRNFLWHNR
jgi:peroxisomal membrane protein 4